VDIYTLGRIIKKSTGSTFKELLQKQRLNEAAVLLAHSDLSIAEVSEAVGYENTSFFHRLFAREMGLSPKAYRDSRR